MTAAGAEQGFQIPDVIIDGKVIEADPPRRLVLSWRMLMDPDVATEGYLKSLLETGKNLAQ